MSIKQCLLALLSERPRHGYELKSEFDQRTSQSWPLNIGQVYTTLDRLERDGLVVRGDEEVDGRVVHSITEAGLAEVTQWFASPVVLNNPPRNELAMKLAIAVTLDGVDLVEMIQTQRRSSIATLQDYTRARRAGDTGDLAWQLVIESLIHTTEAEIRWLDHCEGAVLRAARRQSGRTNSAQLPSAAAEIHTGGGVR